MKQAGEKIVVSAAALRLEVRADCTLGEIRSAAAQAEMEVVGVTDQAEDLSLVAAIDNGALPRRSLLGATLKVGDDEVSFGGMLKDVVGYDFLGLLLGAQGRFGEILSATLRLQPREGKAWASSAPGKTTSRSDLPNIAALLRDRI